MSLGYMARYRQMDLSDLPAARGIMALEDMAHSHISKNPF